MPYTPHQIPYQGSKRNLNIVVLMSVLFSAGIFAPAFALAAEEEGAGVLVTPVFFSGLSDAPVSSAPVPARMPGFGRVPPLRLVYYVTADERFEEEDRISIIRQFRIIRDFYLRFGLEIPAEERVYEVRAGGMANQRDARSFNYVKQLLKLEGIYARGRTLVFTSFDAGLGASGDMAMTLINDRRTLERECPAGRRLAWWCGLPESQHQGGGVHEVGHLLGLKHPKHDAGLTIMGEHWRLGSDSRTGLLPEEIDFLRGRYGAKRTGEQ